VRCEKSKKGREYKNGEKDKFHKRNCLHLKLRHSKRNVIIVTLSHSTQR
jgi:hypothetical protein